MPPLLKILATPLNQTSKEELELKIGALFDLSQRPNEFQKEKDLNSELFLKREKELERAFLEFKAAIEFFEQRFSRPLDLRELLKFQMAYQRKREEKSS